METSYPVNPPDLGRIRVNTTKRRLPLTAPGTNHRLDEVPPPRRAPVQNDIVLSTCRLITSPIEAAFYMKSISRVLPARRYKRRSRGPSLSPPVSLHRGRI